MSGIRRLAGQDRSSQKRSDQGGKMKLGITILVAIVLSVTFGCRGDAKPEPKRFECVERIAVGSSLYRDTETGEFWIRTSGGFAADTWTLIENPRGIPPDKD